MSLCKMKPQVRLSPLPEVPGLLWATIYSLIHTVSGLCELCLGDLESQIQSLPQGASV